MSMISAFKLVVVILIFTIVRETLLDKFWRYERGTHLAVFGNLYIVLGCFISSFIILSIPEYYLGW
jgi:hypothetical protein